MIELARLCFEQMAFHKGTSHFKGFTEIHSRTPTLSSTLFCDNFVKLTVIFVIFFVRLLSIRNSLDYNLLNVNNNKNLQKNAHLALVHLL